MRWSFVLALSIVSVLLFGSHTFAVQYTSDDRFNNANNQLFYSSTFSNTCTSNGGDVTAGQATSDKGNIATAYNYFVGKGLSSIAAAAIVGNLQQESGVRPTALNSIGAYGIAQWLGGRLANLKKESNYKTLQGQLDFLWKELNGDESAALQILKKYTGTDASALAVQYGESFERYGSGEEGNRGKYAAAIFKQYGSIGGTTTGLDTSCGNTGATGFVFYSQTDDKWGTDTLGGSTIGKDGSGVTALAMIISTLTGDVVTPQDVSGVAGADATKTIAATATQFNLTSTDLSKVPMDDISAFVKNGGLVYVEGKGAAPFTTKGSVVVIRGITSDGQFIVANPSGSQSETYSTSVIQANKTAIYGISKS